MNKPQALQPISLGLPFVSKTVKYTQLKVNVCGHNIKLECGHLHHEDITDEILLHLLKLRIAGIQKYRDINKIDLYERNKCAHWSLGRFCSIDIPEQFLPKFTDGEMIDDPEAIQEILIDFITHYNKHSEIRDCEKTTW